MTNFIAGQTLRKGERWVQLMNLVETKTSWLRTIFEEKEVDLLNSNWIDDNKVNSRLVFDGRHYSWLALREKNFNNYQGVLDNPGIVQSIITKYTKNGTIRQIDKAEAARTIINPINLVNLKKKPRLVINIKLNQISLDTKVQLCRLQDVVDSCGTGKKFMSKYDLKAAYSQIALSSETSRSLGFRFANEVFQYCTLPWKGEKGYVDNNRNPITDN